MTLRRQKPAGPVLFWVTVRDEDTGELLNKWSYRTPQEAETRKIEQQEALDPAGRQTVVGIEPLPAHQLPPQFLKK